MVTSSATSEGERPAARSSRREGNASIQFDEEALLTSPSLLAARKGSTTGSPPATSGEARLPPIGSPLSLAERSQFRLHRSSRSQGAHEKEASSASTANTTAAGTLSSSRDRTKVVLRPSWARDEPDSPPGTPSVAAAGTGSLRNSTSSALSRNTLRRSQQQAQGSPSSKQRQHSHHHLHHTSRREKAREQADRETRAQGSSVDPAHCDDDQRDANDEQDQDVDISDAEADAAYEVPAGAAPYQSPASHAAEKRRVLASVQGGGFFNRRRTRRKLSRKIDYRDTDEGIVSLVAAREAARTFGSGTFGSQHQRAPLPAFSKDEGEDKGKDEGEDKQKGQDGQQQSKDKSSSPLHIDLPAMVIRARLKPKQNPDEAGVSTEGGHDDEKHAGSQIDAKRQQMERAGSWTRHQPLSPGWNTPWAPEEMGQRQSIEVGRYRFHAGTDGYFPHTKTGRKSLNSDRGEASMMRWPWWRNFLLHNPFVPLLIRFINLTFTTAVLAVAIRVHLTLSSEDAAGIVGSSPVLAIIFSPLTMLHVAFQIYLEYFGRPIGLWSVRAKLLGTLIEIVFVALWSAELALTFDNYFTSPLVCAPFNSPFVEGQRQVCIIGPDSSTTLESPLNDDSRKPYICRLQGALIGLVFVSVISYCNSLILSLFRIFVRVTAHSGNRT